MKAACVVWTIIGGGDTQTLLPDKIKFELYVLLGSGDTKTFSIPSARTISSTSTTAIPSTRTPYETPRETFTT